MVQTKEVNNKRKSVRVPVNFNTQIFKQDQRFSGGVLNLSVDGMFVQTPASFDENDHIHVIFRLPSTQEPMRLKARVVWGREIEGADVSSFGMGIQFEQTGMAQKKELAKYIQGLLKS